MPMQLSHGSPDEPQYPFSVPGRQVVPEKQPQHAPLLHTPELPLIVHAVLSGLLVVPQVPPLHVGFLHTPAVQAVQPPPPPPQFAASLT